MDGLLIRLVISLSQCTLPRGMSYLYIKLVCYGDHDSLVPRPIPSFSMLHAEKRESLVREITCSVS